jgi:hypothetical protein
VPWTKSVGLLMSAGGVCRVSKIGLVEQYRPETATKGKHSHYIVPIAITRRFA